MTSITCAGAEVLGQEELDIKRHVVVEQQDLIQLGQVLELRQAVSKLPELILNLQGQVLKCGLCELDLLHEY